MGFDLRENTTWISIATISIIFVVIIGKRIDFSLCAGFWVYYWYVSVITRAYELYFRTLLRAKELIHCVSFIVTLLMGRWSGLCCDWAFFWCENQLSVKEVRRYCWCATESSLSGGNSSHSITTISKRRVAHSVRHLVDELAPLLLMQSRVHQSSATFSQGAPRSYLCKGELAHDYNTANM